MSDIATQLRALGSAAEASLGAVSADHVIARADADFIDLSVSDIDDGCNERSTGPRTRSGSRTKVLSAAAVLVVLLLGGAWFANLSREVGQEIAVAPAVTASQPVEGSGSQTVLRNDGTPIGSQLAALDLPGYLIALVDGRPLVYHLNSGAEVESPDARRVDFSGWITADGILHARERRDDLGRYLEDLVFSPWDMSPEIAIGLERGEGHNFAMFDDDVGLVIAVGERDALDLAPTPGDGLTMQVIGTGERKPLGLAPLLAEKVLSSSSTPTSASVPAQQLRFSDAGTVYQWSWDDGWSPIGNGNLVADTGTHRVIERCENLRTCTRQLLDDEGTVVADLSAQPFFQGRLTASSEGGRFAHYAFGGLQVIDASGQAKTVSVPFDKPTDAVKAMVWIGDDHLLLWGPSRAPVLVDVSSGTTSELEFLLRAAGNQPSFVWLAELTNVG